MSDAFPEVSQMIARSGEDDPGIDTVNDAGFERDGKGFGIALILTAGAVVVQFSAEP